MVLNNETELRSLTDRQTHTHIRGEIDKRGENQRIHEVRPNKANKVKENINQIERYI